MNFMILRDEMKQASEYVDRILQMADYEGWDPDVFERTIQMIYERLRANRLPSVQVRSTFRAE